MGICKFFWGTTKQFTQEKATLEPLDLSLKKKFNQAVDANRRTTTFHASEPLDLSLKRKNEAKSSTTLDEPMAKNLVYPMKKLYYYQSTWHLTKSQKILDYNILWKIYLNC